MINSLVSFCFINSWIGAITLAVFAWVAHEQPVLLEIIDKENHIPGRNTLIIGSLSHVALAFFFTIVVIVKGQTHRKKVEVVDDEISILIDPNGTLALDNSANNSANNSILMDSFDAKDGDIGFGMSDSIDRDESNY